MNEYNSLYAKFEDQMWLRKPKLHEEYKDYKNNFSKYVEGSTYFNPILDIETTLILVILNSIKIGCSFYYECLTYHRRQFF